MSAIDDAELVRRWTRGDTIQEIADDFGVGYWRVVQRVNRLRKLGVNLPSRKAGMRGKRIDVAALNAIVAGKEQP